jgi:TPR repeat protein
MAADRGDVDDRMKRAQAAWAAGEHAAALALWELLVQQGVARAQSNLGAAFLEGRGVARDVDKAADLLRRAAEQGDAGGQRNLALCYYEGWGVPQDLAQAALWYEKAATQNDADAQDMLSYMKLIGEDYEGARLWAEKAAKFGRTEAMARLGDIHHNALGVEHNPKLAAAWWRQAAMLGHAEAQAMLGAAHITGEGVPQDRIEALHWLLRAEANGAGEVAAEFLSEARANMEPLDTAEAERRAAAPLPKSQGSAKPAAS